MNLLILGAGDHGRDVRDLAKSLRIFNKVDFLDDNLCKKEAIGRWCEAKKFLNDYPVAIVAVADEETRKKWMNKLSIMGFIIPVLVHPTAYIPDGTEIGLGSVICARSSISSGVKIGKGCIVTTGSIVPRKTIIPDWAYFDIDKCMTGYHEDYYIPEE